MTSTAASVPELPLDTLLQAGGITKAYGGVRALRGVDFDVRLGEVHALVGENGAGKSTLIKMLSGVERPDTGSVTVRGEAVAPGSPSASLAAGISTVYQEPHLFAELTVAENLFLGRELRGRGGPVRWAEQFATAAELLEQIGLDPVLASRQVGDLSVGEQQLISIAKAFATKVRVLILDEPSAILADHDIDTLFGVVRRMRDAGVGVIYISHRLDELAQIADRVTVMRDGEVVTSAPMSELSTRAIAELMIGGELDVVEVGERTVSTDIGVEVRSLSAGKALRCANLTVAQGEIVGVYGLIGSGTGELARALNGVLPAKAGQILIRAKPLTISNPRDSARAGIAMLPGNRKVQGVFLDKSLTFNLSVSHLPFFSRLGFVLDQLRERRSMLDSMRKLRVKAPYPETPIGSLSGGNQQKVVLARQLVEKPSVLVLEEPSQGVDVGAKGEIHRLVFDLARDGAAVLVISTDLDEIRTLSDRVLIMRQGAVAAEFQRGIAASRILAAASGDEPEATTETTQKVERV
ncbi:sugar ABC transporter ATP-binding protein [Arthrobacter sp. EH-1B-1]|uniref:Sugar ABC transporter ATP-binding protein n=1 Tax=Arthrobacter vasquezii TaxID=2977629 RepID=A0ABT6CTR3_9MICC|nr:sugar ABC transporter ATP-binding protein [Arthrobacter vasquezii]MDF9277431.1 sugar ABC transporter ATP-binding protein [Arthrobacter vasquezii]